MINERKLSRWEAMINELIQQQIDGSVITIENQELHHRVTRRVITRYILSVNDPGYVGRKCRLLIASDNQEDEENGPANCNSTHRIYNHVLI